jgi:peptidoglycan/LPS O-acetylase OafA/YrhL
MNGIAVSQTMPGSPATAGADRRQYRTIDALKGISALNIVIVHTPHFFNQWHLPYSYLSVDLFYAMSGFVLATAYESRLMAGMSVADFLRVRLIRLYPLYLLGTLLGIPIALLAMKYGGIGIEWTPQLLMVSVPLSILLLPSPPTTGMDGVLYPLNGPLWTILSEIVANLVYAALAPFIRDTGKLFAVVMAAAIVLVVHDLQIDALDGGATWSTIADGYLRALFSFFSGVLVCRFRQPWKIQSSTLSFALVALFFTIVALPHTKWTSIATVLFFSPVMILACSVVEPGRMVERVFASLGAASYAIYTLHKPLYQALLGFLIIVSPVKPEAMAPWVGIAFLCLLFVGCILVDRLYDMPVRKFLSGLRKKPRPASAVG